VRLNGNFNDEIAGIIARRDGVETGNDEEPVVSIPEFDIFMISTMMK
jgi:hypothetical protein